MIWLGEFLLWSCLLDALCVSRVCVSMSFLNLRKIWSKLLSLDSSHLSMPVIQNLFFFCHDVSQFLTVCFLYFFHAFLLVWFNFSTLTLRPDIQTSLIHSPEFLVGLLNFSVVSSFQSEFSSTFLPLC